MNNKGFSLIEVMVAVAIVAISVTMAIPNYQVWSQSQDLKDGMVNLKGALQIARVTAMATGQPTAVALNAANTYSVFLDNGVGAGGVITPALAGNGEWNGCEVFISAQGQQIVAPCPPGPPPVGAVQIFKTGISFVGAPPPFEFTSSGRRSIPATLLGDQIITVTNTNGLTRLITVSAIGDIR